MSKKLLGLIFIISACSMTSVDLTPPSGATPAEAAQFFGKACEKKGIPDISVDEAIMQGDPSKSLAHQNCVDQLMSDYLSK